MLISCERASTGLSAPERPFVVAPEAFGWVGRWRGCEVFGAFGLSLDLSGLGMESAARLALRS